MSTVSRLRNPDTYACGKMQRCVGIKHDTPATGQWEGEGTFESVTFHFFKGSESERIGKTKPQFLYSCDSKKLLKRQKGTGALGCFDTNLLFRVKCEPLQTGNVSFTLSSSKAITTYLKEEKGNSLHFEQSFYEISISW